MKLGIYGEYGGSKISKECERNIKSYNRIFDNPEYKWQQDNIDILLCDSYIKYLVYNIN